MKPALFSLGILALVVLVLRTGGLRPVSAQPQPPDEQAAVIQVRGFAPSPGSADTIELRINRTIESSRRSGNPQDVVGWSAQPLGERRFLVHYAVIDNGAWVGAEWIVNLANGWVHPSNQYASWLMFDRNW